MVDLDRRESDLVALYSEANVASAKISAAADTLIQVELGPHVRPHTIRIWRSHWPTVTALNFAEGREFHLRLRQHRGSGIYLVYGSVTLPNKQIRQRGHLCRTLADVSRVMPVLRRELQIEKPAILKP